MEIGQKKLIYTIWNKKDSCEKYINRSYKYHTSWAVFEMDTYHDQFNYEVREDVLQYLKKVRKNLK